MRNFFLQEIQYFQVCFGIKFKFQINKKKVIKSKIKILIKIDSQIKKK